MTTFDDDCVRVNLSIGSHTIRLVKLGLEWPPPERLWIDGDGAREATDEDDPTNVMHRVSISAITDEQRAEMTHVWRGAEYRYLDDPLCVVPAAAAPSHNAEPGTDGH